MTSAYLTKSHDVVIRFGREHTYDADALLRNHGQMVEHDYHGSEPSKSYYDYCDEITVPKDQVVTVIVFEDALGDRKYSDNPQNFYVANYPSDHNKKWLGTAHPEFPEYKAVGYYHKVGIAHERTWFPFYITETRASLRSKRVENLRDRNMGQGHLLPKDDLEEEYIMISRDPAHLTMWVAKHLKLDITL